MGLPAAAPGRRERRKLEVRRRMLDAAESLFEDRGVQATTVADICERADVAHKTFFNHFPAKQDLVRALAAASMEVLLEEIEGARREGKNTAERLVYFFERVAARAASAGPMHRELLTEIIHAAQEDDPSSQSARRLHHAFGAIVRDGIATGDVTRRHGAETLTETMLGAYYALMFNWANLDGYPIGARARATARFLADAFAPAAGEATELRRRTSEAAPPRRASRTSRSKETTHGQT